MRIGVLVAGPVAKELAHWGEYDQAFRELLDGHGFEFAAYTVHQGELPAATDACDGWLITGSRYGAYEDHPWIPPLEDFIRAVYAAEVPLVGICFGHQIMAQALGGKVEKSDKGWGLGPHRYESLEAGREILIIAVHQDQVVEKPEEAEVIARSAFCENAGFAYRGRALSYQPHPEMTSEFTTELVKLRRGGAFPVAESDAALEAMEIPLDSAWMGDRIAAFFRGA